MATTAQELESDISQMEDRLASVKVAVEEEREAWRRSTRTGKRGTKWKGAASRRTNNERLASPYTENDFGLSDVDGNFSVMPTYWDALELAQYLQTRQLTSYAQVVVYGQITGKMLLDTSTAKLRKLFAEVAPAASNPNWKTFLGEVSKLHKQQRRLEAVAANSNDEIQSQPGSLDSARGKNDHRPSPSSVMRAAGAALVFPLISPRLPGVSGAGTSTQQQQNNVKPRPVLPLRKPASTSNMPMATCWNCRTRFFRPHPKKIVGKSSSFGSGPSTSSSLRASLSARTYCSKECQDSIEASDIRISPSLSARVQVTFNALSVESEDLSSHKQANRATAGAMATSAPSGDQRDPILVANGGGITMDLIDGASPPHRTTPGRHVRRSGPHVRRPTKPATTLDELESFDFLHVAAPKREDTAGYIPSSSDGRGQTPRNSPRHFEATVARKQPPLADASFSICPSATSIAITSFRTAAASSDSGKSSPHAKPAPPSLMLSNALPNGAPRQCKIYQQSKYKLDPDLFQTHAETFSSCFGATPLSNRPGGLMVSAKGQCRSNLLRLQDYLPVRALHRLSLTSKAWFELIATPSAFSDALWGIHVLRIWRPSEEDEAFLQDVGVLKKIERPRCMLQQLTRQVGRVVLDNMKVLLNPESWQLATVMTPQEGEDVQTLHTVTSRARERLSDRAAKTGTHHQPPAELYEQITVIYTRAGEIVAVCARQLIRPVDPTALLTDILQRLKTGELARVNCRRLRLFSQANRLPFDQWTLLPATPSCSRTVVEFFWSSAAVPSAALPPLTLPAWHQKILSKLQHALQQRLLGKDSVHHVTKSAHEQHAPNSVLLALEKFLTLCHTTTANSSGRQHRPAGSQESSEH